VCGSVPAPGSVKESDEFFVTLTNFKRRKAEMKRIFLTGFFVLGLPSSYVFAQMSGGQGDGMMGGGWRWGMGYGWGFGIIIVILVFFVVAYMMKRR
jgi:hypothetical protein